MSICAGRQASEVCVVIKNHVRHSFSADSRGIGLPTVRTLLERSGGRLDISSSDTLFTVSVFLPIAEGNDSRINQEL